jgi:hypothetical protein
MGNAEINSTIFFPEIHNKESGWLPVIRGDAAHDCEFCIATKRFSQQVC